jgi:hypothetical protein
VVASWKERHIKILELHHHDVLPGRVTEWRAHPLTVADAFRAATDTRPPSYIQEAHLRVASMLREEGLTAPAWLAATFRIPGILEPEALDRAFRELVGRHETLRSGFRLVGSELQRFTLDGDSIRFERNVVADLLRTEDVRHLVETRFDEAISPMSWPAYLFATVTHTDSTTVYLAFDHLNIDAYSLALITYEVNELYAAAVAGRPARLPEPYSYVDFCKEERDSADGIDASHGAVVRWRKFLASCGGALPLFPLDLGVMDGQLPRQTGVFAWLLTPEEAAVFEASCKEGGGNFLAGVLAAAAVVARELAGHPVYRAVVPFHTRAAPGALMSLGWYIGVAPVEIPTLRARGFHDVVAMARDSLRGAKSLARVPFARIGELLGTDLHVSSPDPFALMSYIDMRVVPGAESWNAWRACAVGKVTYGDQACMWVNRGHDGVYLACRYPDTETARGNIGQFIGHMRSVLTTVASAGTYALS